MGLKPFNIDQNLKKYAKLPGPLLPYDPNGFSEDEKEFVERRIPYKDNPKMALFYRLHGYEEGVPTCSVSPYTNRSLKPIIWRNWDAQPMKLGTIKEMKRKYSHFFPGQTFLSTLAPVDFCYLRKEHLHQVNRMLSQFFWPGIDISEALDYPDFSIVAFYKKLIVGCGFMTPDGYITYFFVHPDWERAGIGAFMMYHLIQVRPS
jgi:hypothetical protein